MIVAFRVGTDHFKLASDLQFTGAADDVVIANIAPTSLQMPSTNFVSAYVL
jgi:hypothetical protein